VQRQGTFSSTPAPAWSGQTATAEAWFADINNGSSLDAVSAPDVHIRRADDLGHDERREFLLAMRPDVLTQGARDRVSGILRA